jgi:hypothetical protein
MIINLVGWKFNLAFRHEYRVDYKYTKYILSTVHHKHVFIICSRSAVRENTSRHYILLYESCSGREKIKYHVLLYIHAVVYAGFKFC